MSTLLLHACRSLRRSPLLSAGIVATLGLALAATLLVAGLLDTYLLRPLPYGDSARLVAINEYPLSTGPASLWRMTFGNAADIHDRVTAFSRTAIVRNESFTVRYPALRIAKKRRDRRSRQSQAAAEQFPTGCRRGNRQDCACENKRVAFFCDSHPIPWPSVPAKIAALIAAFVHQPVLCQPGHHAAQSSADFFQRMVGRFLTQLGEMRHAALIFINPFFGKLARLNVFKNLLHGLARRDGPMHLSVHGSTIGDRTTVVIAQDGPVLPANWSPAGARGVGLRNTRDRLTSAFGPRGGVSLRPRPGGGVEAIVQVPASRAGNPAGSLEMQPA